MTNLLGQKGHFMMKMSVWFGSSGVISISKGVVPILWDLIFYKELVDYFSKVRVLRVLRVLRTFCGQ